MIFHLFFTYTFIFPNESVSTAKFQPAKNLVVLADEFYKGKQYNFAIQYFEIAKQIDPSLGSQFNLLFKLGSSYKSAGSNLKAQECFAQLTGDSLLGDYALFELARLQNSSEPEKAMENYLQILRRYPVSVFTPEVCLALCEPMIEKKLWSRAHAYLDSAQSFLKRMPSLKNQFSSQIDWLRSRVFFESGRKDQAEAVWKKIFQNAPYSDEAYLIIQWTKRMKLPVSEQELILQNDILILQGRYSEGIVMLENLRKKTSDREILKKIEFNLGRIAFFQGRYVEAVSRFQHIWDEYKHTESLFQLAKAARYAGKWDISSASYKEYFDRAKLSTPWRHYVIYELANNFSLQGDTANLRKANTYYDQLIEKTNWTSGYAQAASLRKAFNLYKLSEYQAAQNLWTEISGHFPNTLKRCEYWTAKAYEKLNRPDEAEKIFERLAVGKMDNYYGMLSYALHQNQRHLTPRNLFYINDSIPQVLDIREKQNAYSFFGQWNQALNSPYGSKIKKAWLASDIQKLDFAERELRFLIRPFMETAEKGFWLRDYAEFLKAYDVAVDLNSLLKREYEDECEGQDLQMFYPDYYGSEIDHYSHQYRIDRALIYSLIKAESAFRSLSVSHARAVGLMQIMPFTSRALAQEMRWREFDLLDLQDPEISINLGAYYLRQQADAYGDFIPAILGSYNAGPHRADSWMKLNNINDPEEFPEIVEIFETHVYIKRILFDRWIYSQKLIYPNS